MKNKLILMLILISTIFLMPIKNVDVGNKNLKSTNDIVSPLTVTKSDEFRGYDLFFKPIEDKYFNKFKIGIVSFSENEFRSEYSKSFTTKSGEYGEMLSQNKNYLIKIPINDEDKMDWEFFKFLNNNWDPRLNFKTDGVFGSYENVFNHKQHGFKIIIGIEEKNTGEEYTMFETSTINTYEEFKNLITPIQPENLTRSIVTFDDYSKEDSKGNLTLGYKIENQGYDTIIPDNQLHVDVDHNVINLGNIDDIEKGTTKTFDIKYSEKYNGDSDYAENLNKDFKISIEGNPIPIPPHNNKIYTYIGIVAGILITIILIFSTIIFKRFKTAVVELKEKNLVDIEGIENLEDKESAKIIEGINRDLKDWKNKN